METIVNNLINLLKIESITGNEKAICDYIEKTVLAECGKTIALKRIGNSVVVFGPKVPSRKTIILAGHLDTVTGRGFGDDVKVTPEKVIGLGASDMKGGVAVMQTLINKELLEKSSYNLIFVFYHGEEYLYETNGIHDVFKETPELRNADLCFLLEPTNCDLQLGCMGLLNIHALFKGKRAHSARPWEGENAIYKALPYLHKISTRLPREVTVAGLKFTDLMSVTLVSGGVAQNIVPDELLATINVRIPPGKSLDDGLAEIKDMIGNAAEITVHDAAPSCPVPEGNQLVEEFRSRYNLAVSPKQAYNDVAVFSMHGIPAVSFGPGLTEQAHKEGEYILIKDLKKCLDIFYSFLS